MNSQIYIWNKEYIGSSDDGRDFSDSDEYFFETIASAYHFGSSIPDMYYSSLIKNFSKIFP